MFAFHNQRHLPSCPNNPTGNTNYLGEPYFTDNGQRPKAPSSLPSHPSVIGLIQVYLYIKKNCLLLCL